jgi:hypothetical protein
MEGVGGECQEFEFLLPLSLLWSFMMRHVFGFCVCRWFTCLIMIVVLVYLNACELFVISCFMN